MASGSNRNYVGYYEGTGASQDIYECGFEPRYVKVVNQGDGSFVEFFRSMGAANAAAAGGWSYTAGVDDAPAALNAAAGITATASGFQVGTSAACNEDGVKFAFVCND